MIPLHETDPNTVSFQRPQNGYAAASLRRSTVDLEVVVPAFNEAARIAETLARTVDFLRTQAWSSRVVVDNGSVDETGAVVGRIAAENPGPVRITLVGCSTPGKGAAVRRGLLSGTSRFTGFFDADLATAVETLVPVMWHLRNGAAGVIATRPCPKLTFVRPQQLGGAHQGTGAVPERWIRLRRGAAAAAAARRGKDRGNPCCLDRRAGLHFPSRQRRFRKLSRHLAYAVGAVRRNTTAETTPSLTGNQR